MSVIPRLRRPVVVVLLVLLTAVTVRAEDGPVRFHVLLSSDTTTGVLERRAGDVAALRDDVRAFGGESESFLSDAMLASPRLLRSAGDARRALEKLIRWHVVELDPANVAAWKSSVMGRLPIERIEAVNPIELASTSLPRRAIQTSDPELAIWQSWMFDLIDLERAWSEVRGDDGDVVAAVVDVGFDTEHPELAPNLWVNAGEIAGNDVDDDGNGFVDDVHGFNVTVGDGDLLYLEEFANAGPGDGVENSRLHGTLVAGMLGAAVDNGIAGAGIAHNPKLMLVSVQDESGRGLDTTYAYRGITYAALNGAAVINCSWRGVWFRRPGDSGQDSAIFRQFENDVVEAATALGSLVIAAAGNDARTDLVPSPAHYPAVMAVAATNDRSNPYQLWQSTNSGPWVDIAAPGEAVFVITPDEGTALWSGTSLAAPIVSAAALLVKTKWPSWTPAQIRARLRTTALSIDDTEAISTRIGGAGRGMVQVGEAVVGAIVPAVEIRDVRFVADDQSELFVPGDDVAVAFEAKSLFPYDGPVTIRLETDDPFLVPFENSLYLAGVDEGRPLSVRRGLELKLRETTPYGHVALVNLIVEAGEDVDRQSFYVDAVPYQFEVRSAGLELSVAPTGKLGYAEYNRPFVSSGLGFRRADELVSSLYFGALVLGTGKNQVIDAVQPFIPDSPFEDFQPFDDAQTDAVEIETGADGWTTTTLRMTTASRTDGLALRVDQEVLTHEEPARGDFLLASWRVRPLAFGPQGASDPFLRNLHAGLLLDWQASGAGEIVETDPSTRTQWAAPPPGAEDGRWVGARILGPDLPLRASHFPAVGPRDDASIPFMIDTEDLGAAMPDSMLWSTLAPAASTAVPYEGNAVGVLGVGPYPVLSTDASAELVVALSIADSKVALLDALDRARIAWESLREGRDGRPASRLELLGSAPNPFNPRTTIRFAMPTEGRVAVELFDVRGRRVKQLVDTTLDAGYHRVEWDGRDASGSEVGSGVYFVRVRTANAQQTGRLTLVR